MSDQLRDAAGGDARGAFERYFAESRKSKGAGRRPTFERFEDGTYKDDHTQRHWWTWQQARAAHVPAVAPKPLTPHQRAVGFGESSLTDDSPQGDVWHAACAWTEVAHGIVEAKPTAQRPAPGIEACPKGLSVEPGPEGEAPSIHHAAIGEAKP